MGKLVCQKAAIKCVAVGDVSIGKTSMFDRYVNDKSPEEYTPTIFDNYSVTVVAHCEIVNLMLFDTSGQDKYDKLRALCYPGSDVIMVCFSVVQPDSFHNVCQKWLPEIARSAPHAKLILVGTQTDLRDDPEIIEKLKTDKEKAITTEHGAKLAKHIKAESYCECSSVSVKGLGDVFEHVIGSVMVSVSEPKVHEKKFRSMFCFSRKRILSD